MIRCHSLKYVNFNRNTQVAFRVVADKESGIQISDKNLEEFVGKPLFTSETLYPEPPAGVALGLAWTSMGGSTLYIGQTGAK